MSKRDFFTAVFMYLTAGEIPVTSFSLLFNSWPVFWIGQFVIVAIAFLITSLTGISKRN